MRIPAAMPPSPVALSPPPALLAGDAAASPAAAALGAAPSPARAPPAAVPGAAEGVGPNPALRFDPMIGLLVLEFRDQRGESRTIPTERELQAYRTAARPLPGDAREAPAAPETGQEAAAEATPAAVNTPVPPPAGRGEGGPAPAAAPAPAERAPAERAQEARATSA